MDARIMKLEPDTSVERQEVRRDKPGSTARWRM